MKTEVKERLISLEQDGRLTPAAVVEDAKNKASPLHGLFQWDKSKAAYAHWLDQARQLISSVRVVIQLEKSTVKSVYYVRDPSAQANDQGYIAVTTLRSDEEASRAALVAEFTRVADMLRRAREIATVLGARDEVEGLLQQVVGMRQRFVDPPAMQQ